jgi:beta-glucosidase
LTGQPYNLPKEKKHEVPGQRVGLPPYKTRIPSTIVADGPAGLRIKSIRGSGTYYATAFPVGTALLRLGIPFDDQYRGKSDGNEVKEYGVDVFWDPMNIHRNPLCGRKNFNTC